MAVDLEFKEVFTPTENIYVARYVNTLKFISMLQDYSLFFCRADEFEDGLEGRFPELNFNRKIIETRKTIKEQKLNITEEQVRENAKLSLDFQQSMRNLFCINCWNKFENESAALWKIYSSTNEGLLIKSTINRIVDSLKNTPESIYLTKVKYIDYGKDVIPEGNLFYPYLFKSKAYSYENEIRLIHNIIPQKEFNWSCEKNTKGKSIKVDLKILIEEIIISPFSPNWYYTLIKDLLIKYGLKDIPIKKSDIVLNIK